MKELVQTSCTAWTLAEARRDERYHFETLRTKAVPSDLPKSHGWIETAPFELDPSCSMTESAATNDLLRDQVLMQRRYQKSAANALALLPS